MAGDWIKMRSALLDDPDVLEIAARLDLDPPAVCGRLLAVWGWADSVTADGFIKFGKASIVDAKAGTTGFAEAMVAVGWLELKEGGIQFTEWEIHNSKSAKARAQDQKLKQLKREAEKRAKRGDTNAVPVLEQNSGQTSGQKPDRKPDTSSLLFSSLSSGLSSEEGSGEELDSLIAELPAGWENLPDPETEAKAERLRFLVNHPALGFGWNDCQGALDRNYRDIPPKHHRAWATIRGDPELWPLLCEAMRKLKSGVGGLTFSLGTVLSEEGIRKVIGIRDGTNKRSGTSNTDGIDAYFDSQGQPEASGSGLRSLPFARDDRRLDVRPG